MDMLWAIYTMDSTSTVTFEIHTYKLYLTTYCRASTKHVKIQLELINCVLMHESNNNKSGMRMECPTAVESVGGWPVLRE